MRTRRKIKIRKSIRDFYITSAIIILVCSCAFIFNALCSKGKNNIKNKEIYAYSNKFNYDYKVNLHENPYIDNSTLEMSNNAYVTDLINSIDFDLNYNYEGTKKSTIKYKYQINGYINATYIKDGEEQKIWEKEYKLKESEEITEENDKISINENLKLDLKNQNSLVKNFETQMGMNLDAKYLVVLQVETETEVEEQTVKNKYVTTISMDLAEKTMKVIGDNNKQDKKYISSQVEERSELNIATIIINVIIDIIVIIALSFILRKTKSINRVRNEYRYELNRILRLCQDKIVQVNNQIDIENENVINVKDFGEIIKVSEELFKPILYWNNKESEEAWFCVMSNNNTYRYTLKK